MLDPLLPSRAADAGDVDMLLGWTVEGLAATARAAAASWPRSVADAASS